MLDLNQIKIAHTHEYIVSGKIMERLTEGGHSHYGPPDKCYSHALGHCMSGLRVKLWQKSAGKLVWSVAANEYCPYLNYAHDLHPCLTSSPVPHRDSLKQFQLQ